jgi:riboflavin synthase
MFTGLVEGLGRIEAVDDESGGRRLAIEWPAVAEASSATDRSSLDADPLALGESVAINGCCLTVVSSRGRMFDVQAGPETLARTNIGNVTVGDRVNLERALRPSDRLGGHFVQGHVDTTATLRSRRTEGDWKFFAFDIDSVWTPLLVSKGSIAIDGVSLTLVDVEPAGFSIMLIPHTLEVTTFGFLDVGSRVNIETDILAKHVRKLIGIHA